MRTAAWLRRQSAPLLGLDAGSGGIRLVELSQDRGGQLSLQACGQELLDRDWIRNGNIENFDEVVDATRRLLRRSGTAANHVAMALPSSEVISKRVILPAGLSEREMEVQVESEASRYLSFPLDEVSLDFCVVGPSRASPGEVEVQIAATRKEQVEDRQGLAEAVGLKPVILDVDSCASRLALARLTASQPDAAGAMMALVEVGAANVNLQVLRDDELLYERDSPFGSDQLIELLMQQCGFGFRQAQASLAAGELPGEAAQLALQPHMETLALEIERALRLFFTSTPHHRVDRIMLAGEVAGLDGLAELVARHGGVPCAIVNPFEHMPVGRHVRHQRLLQDAPIYLTACGLALRRFLR